MIRKKKKQIEELVTMLEKQTEQATVVTTSFDYWPEMLKRPVPSIYDYDKAKWGTPESFTNIHEPKTYLTNWQKQTGEVEQKEEFDKNLDKLSKIIEAKKHDEEKDLSMALQFESYRKAGLL